MGHGEEAVTLRERGLRAARRAARDYLKRWGVRHPEDIRVEAMADAEGMRIVEGPLRGARGRLSSGLTPIIRIAENTIEEGARRFTIAHEIGHHVLRHPCKDAGGACASARAAASLDSSWRDYEAEANAFASELLMPRHLVAECCVGDPSLEIPRAIALEFTTSIPASAIRYVQLTSARCAAVYSQRDASNGRRRAADSRSACSGGSRCRANRSRTRARAARTTTIALRSWMRASGSTRRSRRSTSWNTPRRSRKRLASSRCSGFRRLRPPRLWA